MSLLLIGPFSRASSLSVKALRAYHEAGLLVPDVVDPQTGYRSYSVGQLTDAAVIRRLRDLDVPLAAVGQILAARDPDVTKKILAEHGAVLEQRLSDTQRAVDDLYAALAAPASHTPVHRRSEPARTVLEVRGTIRESDWQPFLESSLAAIDEAVRLSGAVVDGAVGACFPPMLDDDEQELTAFVPLAAPVLLPDGARATGVVVGELPATDVAVAVHAGGYDTMAETYRNLGAWVATNAVAADLPVRESYLVGAEGSDDPTSWRTEILWPVDDRG